MLYIDGVKIATTETVTMAVLVFVAAMYVYNVDFPAEVKNFCCAVCSILMGWADFKMPRIVLSLREKLNRL